MPKIAYLIFLTFFLNCATPSLRESIARNDGSSFDKALAAIPDKSVLNDAKQKETPPLVHAAMYGNIELMKKLIAAGADVNIDHERTHLTPLAAACLSGHIASIQYLLSVGANASFIHPKSKANLAISIIKVKTLLNNEAEVIGTIGPAMKAVISLPDSAGVTAMHYAASDDRRIPIAESLIRNGANINAADKIYGNTPLHQAVGYNQSQMVKFLLSKGAKLNAKNSAGDTPLKFAIQAGHNDLADELKKLGAK